MQAKLKFGAATAALMMLAPTAFAQSDPTGDAATQARLAVGQSIEGEISPAADSDWYRLSVQEGQRYAITLEGVPNADGATIDPTLAIYDRDGNQLSFNDDADGSLNSALTYTPSQSGEVFVEARGFLDEAVGRYRLNVAASTAPADDVGGDAGTRARITAGRPATGAIESEGDVDWYRLAARDTQHYRIAVTGGEESGQLRDPVVRVIDAEGVELASADDSDGSLNPVLDWGPRANGDVFVEVSGFGGANTGRYALNVEGTRAPTDAISGNTRTRGRVSLGSSVDGSLDFAGDLDWYRLRLEEGQSYRFILNGDGDAPLGDPVLKIYDAGGGELAMDDDGGEGLNAYLEFTAPNTGAYYVEARGFSDDSTGGYVLTARDGDIPADASTDVGLSADGDFREGVLAPGGDHDWYRLDLAAGQGVRIGMSGADVGDALGDPLLAVHGPDGAELARDDDGGEGLNSWLEFVAPAAGTYFLAAQSFLEDGAGRYILQLTPGEIGGNAEGAEFIAPNSEGRTSSIGSSEDTDWFAIDLVEGRPYRFNVGGVDPNMLSDPLLTLFDANGAQVAMDDDGGTGVNAYLSFTSPTGGMYYAAVSGYGGTTGNYYLSVVDTDVPGGMGTDEFLDASGDDRKSRIDIPGDLDSYRVELEAGVRYVIDVKGEGDSPLADPFLAMIDINGERVDADDDSGDGRDARLRFSSAEGGSFLLQVSGLGGAAGDYSISIVRQQ